ncbi:hypothetical protein TMS3_0120835 [Pseudomonas taeanensis MS-3]|uniref:Uncharacterized protein n=1 Tax=Pseudomonas taeanensis MS-3 TaxID=1395571 RepID=A0A0A1YDS4_9PSED|nr:hypothetical protein [Pseudomonas taeanensis]KFX67667.1 hypothetical protein TMS3_0120835 [Pseudomonas taeanensis MS-3]
MSETSEQKSKRNYLHLLHEYQWGYQHSLFYDDLHESTALLDDMVRFKQELRRKCPDQPFLIRIQLHNRKTPHNPDGGLQAYLVILTTKNAYKAISAAADKVMSGQCNVMSMSLTPEKNIKSASAIKSQRPHDLERFFGKEKVNRFTVLNRNKLSLLATSPANQ